MKNMNKNFNKSTIKKMNSFSGGLTIPHIPLFENRKAKKIMISWWINTVKTKGTSHHQAWKPTLSIWCSFFCLVEEHLMVLNSAEIWLLYIRHRNRDSFQAVTPDFRKMVKHQLQKPMNAKNSKFQVITFTEVGLDSNIDIFQMPHPSPSHNLPSDPLLQLSNNFTNTLSTTE